MTFRSKTTGRVTAVVPFLNVPDMKRSVRFYVDGLGFTMKQKWIDGETLRWCWLEKDDAALMMQEFRQSGHDAGRPDGELGRGVVLVFICDDALAIYRDVSSRGIEASEPFVGNRMWNFSVVDPDGYRIEFESPTDVPEDTRLSELKIESQS